MNYFLNDSAKLHDKTEKIQSEMYSFRETQKKQEIHYTQRVLVLRLVFLLFNHARSSDTQKTGSEENATNRE